jgi:hypothetical protein
LRNREEHHRDGDHRERHTERRPDERHDVRMSATIDSALRVFITLSLQR